LFPDRGLLVVFEDVASIVLMMFNSTNAVNSLLLQQLLHIMQNTRSSGNFSRKTKQELKQAESRQTALQTMQQ